MHRVMQVATPAQATHDGAATAAEADVSASDADFGSAGESAGQVAASEAASKQAAASGEAVHADVAALWHDIARAAFCADGVADGWDSDDGAPPPSGEDTYLQVRPAPAPPPCHPLPPATPRPPHPRPAHALPPSLRQSTSHACHLVDDRPPRHTLLPVF